MDINEALPYVGAAYGGIWAVLLIYALTLGRRMARLEKETELLGNRLKQQENKGQ